MSINYYRFGIGATHIQNSHSYLCDFVSRRPWANLKKFNFDADLNLSSCAWQERTPSPGKNQLLYSGVAWPLMLPWEYGRHYVWFGIENFQGVGPRDTYAHTGIAALLNQWLFSTNYWISRSHINWSFSEKWANLYSIFTETFVAIGATTLNSRNSTDDLISSSTI